MAKCLQNVVSALVKAQDFSYQFAEAVVIKNSLTDKYKLNSLKSAQQIEEKEFTIIFEQIRKRNLEFADYLQEVKYTKEQAHKWKYILELINSVMEEEKRYQSFKGLVPNEIKQKLNFNLWDVDRKFLDLMEVSSHQEALYQFFQNEVSLKIQKSRQSLQQPAHVMFFERNLFELQIIKKRNFQPVKDYLSQINIATAEIYFESHSEQMKEDILVSFPLYSSELNAFCSRNVKIEHIIMLQGERRNAMFNYLPDVEDNDLGSLQKGLKCFKESCVFNPHDLHSEPAVYLFLLKYQFQIAQRYVQELKKILSFNNNVNTSEVLQNLEISLKIWSTKNSCPYCETLLQSNWLSVKSILITSIYSLFRTNPKHSSKQLYFKDEDLYEARGNNGIKKELVYSFNAGQTVVKPQLQKAQKQSKINTTQVKSKSDKMEQQLKQNLNFLQASFFTTQQKPSKVFSLRNRKDQFVVSQFLKRYIIKVNKDFNLLYHSEPRTFFFSTNMFQDPLQPAFTSLREDFEKKAKDLNQRNQARRMQAFRLIEQYFEAIPRIFEFVQELKVQEAITFSFKKFFKQYVVQINYKQLQELFQKCKGSLTKLFEKYYQKKNQEVFYKLQEIGLNSIKVELDFKCILRLINWKRLLKESIMKEFYVFDKENKGFIPASIFSQVLKSVPISLKKMIESDDGGFTDQTQEQEKQKEVQDFNQFQLTLEKGQIKYEKLIDKFLDIQDELDILKPD